ncbi:MAG: class I SAM-dependent methyltransferase, partial [Bacteroidetes bacterium]
MNNSGIIEKHYEKYWEGKEEEFGSYARNNPLLKLFSKGEKILDLGCGDGAVGETLQRNLGVEIV